MKTPRKILLEQHQAAAPKLDAIRRGIVDAKFRRRSFAAALWQELILPSRRVWSGLAAVWVLILTVNLAGRDSTPVRKVSSAPPTVSFREEQKILNELFADRTPIEAVEPSKAFSPKPRTEKFQCETV